MLDAAPNNRSPLGAPELPAWAGWALWAGVLLVYLLTSTPYLVGGDNAEFVLLAAQGGRAHPPGYPLYVLYLQAMSWIPALNPAHASSLATALIGASAAGVVYRAASAWGASGAASLFAALILALSPQFWFVSTHAEVFALNHLLGALLIWLTAPSGPLRAGPRLLALGFIAGLGLSNHHTIVLLAPIGFYGIYLGYREASRPLLSLFGSAATLVAGLTPYLQLLAARAHPEHFQWGDISNFSGILHHFLRGDYGTTTLAPYGEGPKPLAHLWIFGREFASDLLFLGMIIGLLGLAQAFSKRPLFTRSRDRDLPEDPPAQITPKPGIFWLFASFCLSGPLFVLLFNLQIDIISVSVIRRFYTLPALTFIIFVALGADACWGIWREQSRAIRAAILMIFFGLLISTSLIRLHANYRPTINDYIQNLLDPLPENTILLSSGDARFLGIEYYQRVEKMRPDIVLIHPSLLRFDWYIAKTAGELAQKHGLALTLEAPITKEELASALLATEHPIYWAESAQAHPDGFTLSPEGYAHRLLPPGEKPPTGAEVMEQNRRLMSGFKLGPPPNHSINPWGWTLYQEHAQVWHQIAEICEREGDSQCQREALEFADAAD